MKTVISERFKSVFMASLVSMMISYVLILTDNVVAGQFAGKEAVAAMTLVAPVMTLIFFLSYMIADGLAMMFSYAKGLNDRQKANEIFSMGVFCALGLSIPMTIILYVFDEKLLSLWGISAELTKFALEYYHGLIFATLPTMLNIFFYTIYIAEGEENICVRATIAMFVVNVVLDVLLGYKIGVIGIGIATTIGNLVSFLFHIPYLFSPKCQLRLKKYWNNKEFWQGIYYSWCHSMDTLYLALLPLIFSAFVLKFYGEMQIIVVTVIVNMLTLLIAIYTGIVDCIQPMVCQYHKEKALKSILKTMKLGTSYTIGVTLAIILFGFIFAEFLPGLFGVAREEQLYPECVLALRIFISFTLFLGITLMFANYYIYVERLLLGTAIKTLLLLILPSLGMFLGIYGLNFMWAGVGISFIVALIINLLLTKQNLLLMDWKEYSRQFSLDTENKPEKLSELRIALEKYFSRNKFAQKPIISVLIEEIFTKYAARTKKFQLEVSIIPADRFILLFRDNGEPLEPQLDIMIEKNYMISGDENKFVVII